MTTKLKFRIKTNDIVSITESVKWYVEVNTWLPGSLISDNKGWYILGEFYSEYYATGFLRSSKKLHGVK